MKKTNKIEKLTGEEELLAVVYLDETGNPQVLWDSSLIKITCRGKE